MCGGLNEINLKEKIQEIKRITKINKLIIDMDKEQEEQINEELDRALSNPKVKDFVIALGKL